MVNYKNKENYSDPTAFCALNNAIKSERKKKREERKRADRQNKLPIRGK